jgi:hypothetical protein
MWKGLWDDQGIDGTLEAVSGRLNWTDLTSYSGSDKPSKTP